MSSRQERAGHCRRPPRHPPPWRSSKAGGNNIPPPVISTNRADEVCQVAKNVRGTAVAPHVVPPPGDRAKPGLPARNAVGGKGRNPGKSATSAENNITPPVIFTSRACEVCEVAKDVRGTAVAPHVVPPSGDRATPGVPALHATGERWRTPRQVTTSAKDTPPAPPAPHDTRKTRPGGQRERSQAPTGETSPKLPAPPAPRHNKKTRPGGPRERSPAPTGETSPKGTEKSDAGGARKAYG